MAPSWQVVPGGGVPADKAGRISAPTVSLPKGGGALRGIGETFAVAGATGTAGLRIPLPLSPGRSGFGPALELAYDSGAGNGLFGLGWSLDLPAITRKTDTGLPRYLDGDESDVFLLSGAEDLVPVLAEGAGGDWAPPREAERDLDGRSYRVRRYRPRVESAFARVERWTDLGDGTTHWRSITGDNVTSLYGTDDDSRIQDPDPPHGVPPRVASWLISETRDDRGNVVRYRYRREDDVEVDARAAHEQGRPAAARTVQRYLKRVVYGNRTSGLTDAQPGPDEWMFEVVFDYGDHDADPKPTGGRAWHVRSDPFSSWRTGFEVRTYRLCRRVLMFHHFPDEPTAGRACLVRSLELEYDEDPVASLLVGATQRGFRRTPEGVVDRALPPLELMYSPVSLGESSDVRRVESEGRVPPVGEADPAGTQWVDLDGEGIPGVLVSVDGGGHYYAPNRGGGRLASPTASAAVPSAATVGQHGQLLDLAGDGRLDLAAFDGPNPGFFQRIPRGGWTPFRSFAQLPNVDWKGVRFVDLNGDGHADVLVAEGDAVTWYPSAGEEGFGPAVRVASGSGDDRRPALVFADAATAVFLADMTGDGLADLVRVRHDEVRYWPNRGHGRFGDAVVMDDPPLLDRPDLFDPRRVLLADLDGAGPQDLLYAGTTGTRVYANQSGNRWATPVELPGVPAHAVPAAVDLLGTGTPCLVWSRNGPGDERSPAHYLELMPRGKPHLLTGVRNNLGAETLIGYTTSTAFHLADQAAGRPWATRLPFPVHVVSRVDTVDHVSRNRFTTRYAYRHGHFDGTEREFRGFARVDQWDTEEFASLSDRDPVPAAWPEPANLDRASHSPPARTTTWYHTGAFADADELSAALAREYYREGDADRGLPGRTDDEFAAVLRPDRPPPPLLLRPDGSRSPLPLRPDEAREACRAMRGAMLRREVYAEDGTDAADRPYTVEEFSYGVDLLQPRGPNRHAVFLRHPREALTMHYERTLHEIDGRFVADPRIGHELVLSVDGFGNVLRSASIAYGRRHRDGDPRLEEADHAAQRRARMQVTERAYTVPVDRDDVWRTPLPCDTRTYEVHGYPLPAPDSAAPLAEPGQLAEKLASFESADADLPYHDVDGTSRGPGTHRRLIAHQRSLFRRDDLSGPEALGIGGIRALPHEHYRLAFTPELLGAVYRRDGEALLADPAEVLGAAGYRESGELRGAAGFPDTDRHGLWWEPSGTVGYGTSPNGDELAEAGRHFFVPSRFTDPFGAVTSVAYDEDDLLIREISDARGNRTTAGERRPQGTAWRNDYRVLAPAVVTDANGNRAAAAYDALGMVVGTAVLGKIDAAGADEDVGDTLDGFAVDLPDDDIIDHVRNPADVPLHVLGGASTRLLYDLDAFHRWWRDTDDRTTGGPPSAVLSLARERHLRGPDGTPTPRVRATLTYSDGLGREIGRKARVDAGPLTDGGPDAERRWVATGWTVFDNKGRPVRQYEPFFSDTAVFEFGSSRGVAPVLLRDPLGRVAATLHPDHTWEKSVFDPWSRTVHDAGDTVDVADASADPDVGAYFGRLGRDMYLPSWRSMRLTGPSGPEKEAARQSQAYADTPESTFIDSLGAEFLGITVNRYVRDGATTTEQHPSRVDRDIQGHERAVHDARGRVVMRYAYDLLGNRVHSEGMDCGARWTLHDAEGRPVRAWNTLGNDVRTTYDELRRPTEVFLRRAGADTEIVVERTTYGDDPEHPGGADAAVAANLRGRVHTAFDGAGAVTCTGYDFTGNLVRGERRLAADYRGTPDWSRRPALDGPAFATETRHDALGRPIAVTLPDGTRLTPGYNAAGLLDTVTARVRGGAETRFVEKIDYDAHARRTRIAYGNGVKTEYHYDPLTFLLSRLHTRREGFPDDCPAPDATPCGVQFLSYTYDAAGNVTHIRDDAQQTVFFRNQRVEAGMRYVYDAVYRLIEATGREHLGQAAEPAPGSWTDAPRTGLAPPGDGQAMGAYRERYTYDEVGNLRSLEHKATGAAGEQAGWTRTYRYREGALEPGLAGNRLSTTDVGGAGESYEHDAHGNMTAMPHTTLMRWDHGDRLVATSTQRVDAGTPETTYYVYDAAGRRIRKVTERFAPQGTTPTRLRERIYLGAVEVYREYGPDGDTVTLERETLHVTDDAARVALVETRTRGSDRGPEQLIRYQFADHLGSVALELDDRARFVSYEEYHPYGSTSFQAVASAVEAPKRYRFTGKERDEESGLMYHGARYYAPWLGRWTSCDPAGLADGANLYVYAGCDPCGWIDPDGRASTKHKLNDVVKYSTKVEDRAKIGKNVQKDHIIAQSKMRLMRTDPKGTVHYKPGEDPAVLAETGKATATSPAKPHTQKTFHGPESDVAQLNKLKKQGMQHFTTDVVEPSREAALKAGYKPESVDEAVKGQLDKLHESQTLKETGQEAKELAAAGKEAKVAKEGAAAKKAVVAGKEAVGVGGKDLLGEGAKVAAKKGGKWVGGKAAKLVPGVGIAVGIVLVSQDLKAADHKAAAWDAAEAVPLVGDVVGAGHIGIEAGMAGNEALGIDKVAAGHGESVRQAITSVGGNKDVALVTGGIVAATSAITVAPPLAIGNAIGNWIKGK